MASTRTRTVGAAAVALAVAVGVVVVQPSAGAAPPPGPAPEPLWRISVAGEDLATSRLCTGLGSRSDVLEVRQGSDGQVVKSPGTLRAPDVTCALGLSSDTSVYDWRREVEVGGASTPREAVELVLTDVEGQPVQTWQLQNAWPSQYLVGPDRAVVTITHEQAVLQ